MNELDDRAWAELSATWTTESAPPLDRWIRMVVARQTTLLRLTVIAEVVVTVAVLAPVTWLAATRPGPGLLALAIAGYGHTALIWGFVLWNRAGIWRPLAETTRAYLAVAEERCRREARAGGFVIVLALGEIAALAVWWALTGERVTPRRSWWWLSPAGVTLGAIGWGLWARHRARGRLEGLRQRSLGLDLES